MQLVIHLKGEIIKIYKESEMDYINTGFNATDICWRYCYYMACMLVLHGWFLCRNRSL